MSDEVDPHEATRAESMKPGKMQAGFPIGNYELRDVLGEGGMGVVWRAHDPKLDREIAIKVLKRMDAPQSLRQRLQREARAMARLKHPNVLTVYDSGTAAGRDFIAMELVDGCSLDVWLERTPPTDEVVAAMLASGRGLAAAHRAGLVHRDFKPHNVLRSNDGRILVTDFGLARGLGDESMDTSEVSKDVSLDDTQAQSVRASKTDSVLDSPLTQTGVLIGTPAYMAPEQFEGAAPDPRTDQFAFCVSAWQMLTGARPYHGNSLDELRIAASEGVAHVKTTLLSPVVRAALVRGLDPDPAKRWPDMDQLLDTLEKATRPKRPAWLVPMMIFVTLFSFTLVGAIVRKLSATREAKRACEPADVAFGDAWSPSVRAALWKQLEPRGVSEAAFGRIADTFDAWRTSWMQSYDVACRAAPAKLPRAKLACLYSARDNAGAISLVLEQGTPPMFEGFDAHGILPNIVVCDGPSPVSPPPIPTENRARVLEVMARSFALRMQDDIAAGAAALIAEAEATKWPPLVPMILLSLGNEQIRRGDSAAARDAYERGAKLAKSDPRLLASLRLGILETSLTELANPDTPIKSGEVPGEIAALITAARASAKAAGNDPILMASVSLLEGNALAARARWTYDKALFADALAALTEAQRLYSQIGDLRRAAATAADMAEVYSMRSDERALDDATFVSRSAEEALERAKLPPVPQLDAVQARIAFARGEYGMARARYAKLYRPAPPRTEPAISGKVVAPDGKPIGEATVVAWVGVLDGDPQNLVTDARTIDGESVQTAPDGTFTVHAPAGAAIVAQRGTARSTPLALREGMTLELMPTDVIAGRLDGRDTRGVVAFAQIAIAKGTWRVRAAVHRDGTYSIGGISKAPDLVGALSVTDDGTRWVRAIGARKVIEWRHGRPIEVVVRGGVRDGAQIYILPGRTTVVAPKTRAEADALLVAATEYAIAIPHPIGATATQHGRDVYRRGDGHAVIAGFPPTFHTACVAPDAAPETPVTCVEIEVKDGDVTDFPDGRWGSEPQPILVELPER